MESLKKTWSQFQALFAGMAPSQRLTLIAVPLLVIAGLAALMYSGSGSAEEHLLGGKVFSAEELKSATEALQKGGMSQFRVDGQKILVPKAEATRYNAALLANGGLPADFGAELEKMYEKVNVFTTDKERQELRELGKQKVLAKWIKALPEVEDASVLWERSRSRPFGGGAGKVTATVSVRPKPGRDLSQVLVSSLRQAVAGAVADLSPSDVTIFNMTSGVSYRADDPNDPFNSQFIDQVKQFQDLHQRNISKYLDYIPNVIVTVHVDLDNLKGAWEKESTVDAKAFQVKTVEQKETLKADERRPNDEPGSRSNAPASLRNAAQAVSTNTRNAEKTNSTSENVPVSQRSIERALIGLLPKSVQVAISIPKDYYRDVARKQGESESDKQNFMAKVQLIETETLKQVKESVAKLVPTPTKNTGSAVDNVSVTSYVRLDTETAAPTTSFLTLATEMLSQWGGPAGLALFTLWVLWTLQRSVKRLPQEPATARSEAGRAIAGVSSSSGNAGSGDDDEDEEPVPKEATKRDKLQGLVKDNPEMAAAVISRWLAPPK